jgi:serine/threonine-protein kinase
MSCPHCGGSTAGDARFCPQCGRELAAVTLAPSDQATYAATRAPSPSGRHQSPPASEPHSSSGWLTSSDSISHGRFSPGAILDGRYRVIGLLGRGGMGEVYRADDLRLGQPVALKFLPSTVANDPVRLAQFHNEVRTARQVSHPNICRVYDIGEIEGQLFLSMEFVDGEDLATSLRRIGRFPEDKAIEIARQLCAGLAAAHDRGVIHRDLKPANVMLDDLGKVRVMDFGLAAIGAVEEIRVGTPAYMAPEQLLGRGVTARSDIFALGLVLYELFTGRRVFTATTLKDLVEQHQSGELTPPSTLVSTLDPAIERAILRCLEREPSRRPASALAVAAALPGGDPLAAALAAGETPSPEMVAAAGEGEGLDGRVAWPVFVAILLAIAGAYAMALRMSVVDRLQPEFNRDVLAQKARDVVLQIGYSERPADEAFGFEWDDDIVEYVRANRMSSADAPQSPLTFWYRRSPFAMTGVEFHDDFLTPGVVSQNDPAPLWAGMMQLRLDHRGRLQYFEAVPRQREEGAARAGSHPVDWPRVMALAGIDAGALQPAPPQWNWLAAADSRVAWTGTWPNTTQPLRVEAAALAGQPIAFLVIGPWTEPWREAAPTPAGVIGLLVIYLSFTLLILIGGSVLARRNLRAGRGDREGAIRLGVMVAAALWIRWICQVHLVPSVGLIGMFLLTVVTTVFYAVVFWAVYLAIEPFVRRYWPRTLVSWTSVLRGGLSDPVVGRDVMFGVALGLAVVLLIDLTIVTQFEDPGWPSIEAFGSVRMTTGAIVSNAVASVRMALLIFFLLFLLRVLLRQQWIAAIAFAALFGVMDALDGARPLVEFLVSFTYFGLFAIATVRWGFTTLVVSVMVANLVLNTPVTANLSAWWFSQSMILLAVPVALAAWGFYRSVGGRLWRTDLIA